MAGDDKSLAEAVVADLQAKGICKFQITIEAVKDKPVFDGLDSFLYDLCGDMGVYRALMARLEMCVWPKDMAAALEFLAQRKVITRSEKYNTMLIERLFLHTPNFRGKKYVRNITSCL